MTLSGVEWVRAPSLSMGCARFGHAARGSSRRQEAEGPTVGPPLAGGPSWDYENRIGIFNREGTRRGANPTV